jgi:MoxR-like ATPase
MSNFTYGGIRFTPCNPVKSGTPDNADEIILKASQRKAIAQAIRDNKPCLLVGDTGTGKTGIIRYLAHKLGKPYYRVSLDGHITPDELIGGKGALNGSTFFDEGVVIKAMREGALLVVDELNSAPPDTTFIFHSLLDKDQAIRLPTGEVVKPHKDFRFFATMNRDYNGTKDLNMAFFDRFPIVLEVQAPSPDIERKLLTDTGLDEIIANRLVAFAVMSRKAYHEGKSLLYVSTRSLLQWGDLIVRGELNTKDAFNLSVLPKSNKDERDALNDLYNAGFQVAPDGSNGDDEPVIVTNKVYQELKAKADKLDNSRDMQEREIKTLTDTCEQYKSHIDEVLKHKVELLDKIDDYGKALVKAQERVKSLEYLENIVKGIKHENQ